MWRIEFSSAEFLPYLPEDAQANPGVYGFELAHWLSNALAQKGVITSYPLGEDWGWFIEYFKDEIEVTIGCASVSEEDEGYKAKPITWSIFVKSHQPLKKLFARSQPVAVPKILIETIETILKEKPIEWQQVEE